MGSIPMTSIDTAIFSTIGVGIILALAFLAFFLRTISKDDRSPVHRKQAHRRTGVHSHTHNK